MPRYYFMRRINLGEKRKNPTEIDPWDNYTIKLAVCLNCLGAILNSNGRGHNEINLGGDLIKLCKHSLESYNVVANDLESRVNENIGDIGVGSKNTCDEAVESVCITNGIRICINKSCLICNIVDELITLLNANYVTLGFGNSIVYHLDKSLGFAGAFAADE